MRSEGLASNRQETSPQPEVGEDCLDSQEFYEICQAYRHAEAARQDEVVMAFEALKAWVREHAGEVIDRG